MTEDEMLDALTTMDPGHFERLLFRLAAPVGLLPGREAPQATRAIEMLRYFDNARRLDDVRAALIRAFGLPAGSAGPPPRLLEVLPEDRFLVRDAKGDLYVLLWALPELPASARAVAVLEARHWKRVHTLTERLYHGYRQLHVHMIRCGALETSDGQRRSAESCIDAIRPQAEFFSEDIGQLPVSVAESPPIAPLRHLRVCSDAIKSSIAAPALSQRFGDGVLLVEHIEQLLLRALHIADLILEEYFAQRGHEA